MLCWRLEDQDGDAFSTTERVTGILPWFAHTMRKKMLDRASILEEWPSRLWEPLRDNPVTAETGAVVFNDSDVSCSNLSGEIVTTNLASFLHKPRQHIQANHTGNLPSRSHRTNPSRSLQL
jgi:hypothetical protein